MNYVKSKEELVKKSNQPQKGNKGSMSNTVIKEPKHLNELLRLLPNKLESRRSYLWNELNNPNYFIKGQKITEEMGKSYLKRIKIINEEKDDIDFLLDFISNLTNYDYESWNWGTKNWGTKTKN